LGLRNGCQNRREKIEGKGVTQRLGWWYDLFELPGPSELQ